MSRFLIYPENESTFDDLILAFKAAEKRLKTIEREDVRDGLDIPSVNELRYVSFHILASLETDDVGVQQEQIKRAIRHCQRASYDAVELRVLQLLEDVQQFRDDYRLVPVSNVLLGYVEMMAKTQEINQFIADASDETKPEYYEICEQKLEDLKIIVVKLDASREELNKLVNKEGTELKKWLLMSITAIIAAISSIYVIFK
jgi:hypothetical protein